MDVRKNFRFCVSFVLKNKQFQRTLYNFVIVLTYDSYKVYRERAHSHPVSEHLYLHRAFPCAF